MRLLRKPKIGLALSGGGPRGLAHIGVIKILEQHNIPIDYISGTSIGALIGGLYAAKKNINDIEQLALANNWKEIFALFFDPSFRKGLVRGEKIKEFIQNYTGEIEFKDLKIPFTAVATDIQTGRSVHISKGSVPLAIRASISLPVIFSPVEKDGRLLVDGGLSDPVPVHALKKMGADLIIAVNLYEDIVSRESDNKLGLYKIANNTIDILLYNLAKENLKSADFVISPKTSSVKWSDLFTERESQEAIEIGETAASRSVSTLTFLIKSKQLPFLDMIVSFFKRFFER